MYLQFLDALHLLSTSLAWHYLTPSLYNHLMQLDEAPMYVFILLSAVICLYYQIVLGTIP